MRRPVRPPSSRRASPPAPDMRGATSAPRSLGWLLLPVLLVLALFLGSVALLFFHAFWGKDGFSLVYFRQILERADYHEVFLRTVSIAAIVAVASAVLAYPIAWLLWRLPRWRNGGGSGTTCSGWPMRRRRPGPPVTAWPNASPAPMPC